jgi:hypothetical protein
MLLRRRHAIVVLTGLLAGTTPLSAQGLHLISGVEELPSDSIGDIAIAAVDLPQPTIYYNPRMVRRYGPLLTRFFIAHEYGHIQHRHTRVGLIDLPEAQRDSLLRAQELEADCYAASQPDDQARQATEAAIRFFSRLGPFRFDAEHPTGSQRAGRILTCLPGARQPVLYGRGETGVEVGPVSGEPELVDFEVHATELGAVNYGSQAVLWVDGQRVGSVSNMRLAEPLRVNRFGAGIHSYRLVVEIYGLDSELQFNANGSVTGRGQLLVRNGDRFRVNWVPGSVPTLVPEAAAPPEAPTPRPPAPPHQ